MKNTFEMERTSRVNSNNSNSEAPEAPSPLVLLAVFCALNLLVYIDRGAIGSNGMNADGFRPSFQLNLFQDGLLPAAFMIGMLVAAPIFAEASKKAAPFRLMAIGLAIWAGAVAGCGLSFGFYSILICRMLVGVGEASFVSLAAPFIDDTAPVSQKTRWLAAFFLCIPVGYAVGFIYGGTMPQILGWRISFLVLSVAMLPFIAFCWWAPPIKLRGTSSRNNNNPIEPDAEDVERHRDAAQMGDASFEKTQESYDERSSLLSTIEASSIDCTPTGPAGLEHGTVVASADIIGDINSSEQGTSSTRTKDVLSDNNLYSSSTRTESDSSLTEFWRGLGKDAAVLLGCKVYLWVTTAATAYTAAMGTYAYWGPSAGRETFHVVPRRADLAFGLITVLTGSFGTLTGGALLDHVGSSIRNGLLISAVGLFLGGLGAITAFCFARGFNEFCILFAFAEFAMFMTQAPSSALTLWSVPPGLRPLATSMGIVAVHVFGDVPMPPLAGLMQSVVEDWRITMSIVAVLLLLGAVAYTVGIKDAHEGVDFRQRSNPPIPRSSDGRS